MLPNRARRQRVQEIEMCACAGGARRTARGHRLLGGLSEKPEQTALSKSWLSTEDRAFWWARAAIIVTRGGNTTMGDLSVVLQQLKKERDRVQKEVQRIDAALAALGSVSSNGTRPHTMSAAARRRISLAQKARWAKQRAPKPKRTISAAGRRRIAAAQRARWAKIKHAG
jgi:hypothetical protein